MAETLEQTASPKTDEALDTAADATPNESKAKAAASAKGAQDASNQSADSPAEGDDLQILIEKVKSTIASSLDDQAFDKELRKHIKKIKGWKDWSEHAKSAFAHMWAAQLLHNKAIDIKKDNKMDFTPVTGDSYKKLVRSLTHRVRF
jgi:hypothetical protein